MFVIPPGLLINSNVNDIILPLDYFGIHLEDFIAKPIKVWMNRALDIEPECFGQLMNLANLPFIHSHVSQMADGHKGYGMSIGGVIATKDVIIPNAVGKDVGCGMLAFMLTNLTLDDIMPRREDIVAEILKKIPVGFDHRKNPFRMKGYIMTKIKKEILERSAINGIGHPKKPEPPVFGKEKERIEYQTATLGGGNHFIEIQKDEEGHPWIMIHSGSRNFGSRVCGYYDKIAADINDKYYSQVPRKWELAFIPREDPLFNYYWYDMQCALYFAYLNRLYMHFVIVEDVLPAIFGKRTGYTAPINIHHNYASLENHFGKNVFVHRKGATQAKKGQTCIIPGSMGTNSYIGKGLGNKDSFESCSHGSGRALPRNKALKKFTKEQVLAYYKERDIVLGVKDLEKIAAECDWAYKDIKDVMKNQEDLVKIVHELTPVAVVKG